MNWSILKSGKGGTVVKIAGILLMVIGFLILLFCVPLWFWTMLLGVALAAGGFLLWRFCG